MVVLTRAHNYEYYGQKKTAVFATVLILINLKKNLIILFYCKDIHESRNLKDLHDLLAHMRNLHPSVLLIDHLLC